MIHAPSIALSFSAVRQMMVVEDGAYGRGGCSWHPGRRERGVCVEGDKDRNYVGKENLFLGVHFTVW